VNCAYDHWEGTSNARVRNNVAVCGKGYGILFTGVGTDANDHRHAEDLIAENNRIEGSTEAGIWICSLSQHSSVSNVLVRRNTVVLGTGHGAGIGATGAVSGLRLIDNTVVRTRGGPALFTRPDKWNRPRDIAIVGNQLIDCETADVNQAAIQALGDTVVVQGNRASGGHYRSLVAVDGAAPLLDGNSGDGLTSRFKYDASRARGPRITDP
jgi:hypothetical protein